jgi:hypothetical protein
MVISRNLGLSGWGCNFFPLALVRGQSFGMAAVTPERLWLVAAVRLANHLGTFHAAYERIKSITRRSSEKPLSNFSHLIPLANLHIPKWRNHCPPIQYISFHPMLFQGHRPDRAASLRRCYIPFGREPSGSKKRLFGSFSHS